MASTSHSFDVETSLHHEGEAEWQRLKRQLELVHGFWLGALFTPSSATAAVFQRRTKDVLKERGQSVHLLRPDSPQVLREVLPLLFNADSANSDVLWLEALQAEYVDFKEQGAGPWTEAWESVLLRLNERRDRLRRHLRGGLMMVMPPVLKPLFRRAAPDLWSIRQVVLEPVSDSDLLPPLREAEGLLLRDQALRARSLAHQAIASLESDELKERRDHLLPMALALLARTEAATGDFAAAIRQIRRAIDLRAGMSPDPTTLQWFDLWLDFARRLRDAREIRKAEESGLRYREQVGMPAAPAYVDDATRELAMALEEAYRREEELLKREQSVVDVRREILALRRRLREGGQLRAGDFLLEGRFRLLKPLGKGGFATVWKAYDRKHRELVAVKVLHGQHAQDRTRRERFFRGARKMAELRHAHIVGVIEKECEDGGYYYFVMEYMEGGDLRQAVLKGHLSRDELLRVVLAVGEALAFAHERGVLHRDVKPGNILLNAQGQPKLTDFDLVRAIDTTGGTRTGSMLGTFLYAAPESLERSQDAGVSADVYGLGMTTVFALHGGDLPSSMLRDPSWVLDRLQTTPACRKVLEQAIAWVPEDRPSSMTAFCRALQECLEKKT